MSMLRKWKRKTGTHWRLRGVSVLLIILGGGMFAGAQEDAEKEIIVAGATFVSSRPLPVINHVYDDLRVNIWKDWSAVSNDNPDYYVRPVALSSFRDLTIAGGLIMGGPLRGVGQQFIDLNDGFTDEGVLVHSVQVANRIVMEGPDPGPTGKCVYDVAESMNAPGAGPADVVIISPQQDITVEPSTRPYDTRVAGVISTEPKMYLGPDKTKQPLALAGVVLCKASAENGPIKPGDLLVTSSHPGRAMRADPRSVKPGMLVGRALQPLAQGTGAINILINQ